MLFRSVCNPDRPVGRKKVITAPLTKTVAQKYGIPVLQPEKLDESFTLHASRFTSQFAIVAAYAKIIPKDVIELFPKGVIGVHPSLLPKYRGASPIQSAILGGEKETGVTLYMLDEKMDHGKTVSSVKCQVSSNDAYETLLQKLAELSGQLLVKTLPKFVEGKMVPQAQDEARATFTKKFATQDGFVDEKDLNDALAGDAQKANEVDRKIRALNPEPGVWTYANSHSEWAHTNKIHNGTRVKFLDAKIEDGRLVLVRILEVGGRPRSF